MYTSPLERAVETAAIVGESHAIVPQPDSAIGEVRFGDWEGLTMQELESFDLWRRYNQFRSGTRPPGGETMLEVQGRMVRRLEELSAAHGDTCIGLVSHGDPLRATLAYYLGVPLDLLLRFEVAPASLSVLELAEWGARVQCLNQTEAL